MVIPKINSAHGSDTRNILNAAINSVNAQGKSIQDLVAEGQLTPTQYAQLIQTVNGLISKGNIKLEDIDKNNFQLDQTYLTEELKQQMAGNTPINAVPANYSITSEKIAANAATYVKRTKLGDSAKLVSFTNPINFDLINNKVIFPPSSHVFTGDKWIRIVGSNKQPVEYDMNLDVGSIYQIYFNAQSVNDTLDFVFKTHNDNSADLENYVLIGLVSRYSDGFVSIDGNFLVNGKPQIDIPNDYINYDQRTKIGNAAQMISFNGPIDFDFKNNKIHFPPSTQVFTGGKWIRIVPSSGAPISFDLGDVDGSIFLIYINAESSHDSLDIIFRKIVPSKSIDVSENYVLLGAFAGGSHRYVYINGNYTIDGKLPIPDKMITRDMISDSVLDNLSDGPSNQYHYYDELNGTFETPAGLEDKSSDLDTSVPNDIYALYDNLMSLYPNNITRRTLGYSQLADGTEDTTLPIYEYTFNPFRGDANTSVKVPRILIQAGIHGYEKISVWATWKWFESLLNETDDVTTFMRNNIDFHVVPIANPYSYFHNIRHNVNGVDVNCNFEMDWYKKTNDGSPNTLYGGEAPMTEMETQVLDSWYAEFQDNAIGFLDMHNTGVRATSKGAYGLCWYISGDEGVRTMAQNILNSMSRKWRKDFPELDEIPNDVMFGDVSERTDGTARNQALKKYNIKSLTLDPSWNFGNLVSGATKYSKETNHINVDVLGASVLSFVKNFGK